ncbi:hypothetical protein GNIT_2940 [Glaciecola nitratireducens FR1064]|uniref:Uncharacterized protein n=1 Tax=Glaciecola nitratireducens (strain JCM 12485 / KCTC 12276 / FR1064) TaxID=1085623 RepID=G4QMV4_GLANF|nr:hypothetical protein GNIT_2940 [Glaciecola nitratireducens FR1064]
MLFIFGINGFNYSVKSSLKRNKEVEGYIESTEINWMLSAGKRPYNG